jgi:hypothetical protein
MGQTLPLSSHCYSVFKDRRTCFSQASQIFNCNPTRPFVKDPCRSLFSLVGSLRTIGIKQLPIRFSFVRLGTVFYTESQSQSTRFFALFF